MTIDSLLGPFIQRVPDIDQMRRWLHLVQPAVVLTMENSTCEAILGNRPSGWDPIVIGRKNFNPQPLRDPRGVARSIVDSQWMDLIERGIVSAMMLYNEINPHDERWREYLDWQYEAMDELSWNNIRYIAGSWSVGCPDELYYRCPACGYRTPQDLAACPDCGGWTEKRIVYWDEPRVHQFLEALAIHGGMLGLHQYCGPGVYDERDFDPSITDPWDPTINTSWRILRHRKVRSQLEDYMSADEIPDFVITECGVEVGAVDWPIPGITPGELAGWQTTQSVEDYMNGLRWLDYQCRHDGYLRGLIVFLMGTYPHQADGSEGDWVTHCLWNFRQQFGEAILCPLPIEEPEEPEEPVSALEEWLVREVSNNMVDQLPFVPDNFIEALGLRMGWVPTSDEWMVVPPEEAYHTRVWVKVFVAPELAGGWEKKIVYWEQGDWENYKVITVPL